MIKRVFKKKSNRHGSILVVVVLILALAMIFITAAMMLTQATRTRLYEKATQSQARLTVTSASEVFLEALQTQEITDEQINTLLQKKATKSPDNSTKIRMVIDGVPGMAPSSSDPDDKNCTYLDIYYPVSSDKTVVWCDFTTTIGDDTENVRIELKYQPQTDPEISNRFSNQIDTSSYSDAATLRFTGGIGVVTNSNVHPSDNTVLLRGGALELASGGEYYSNLVFGPGTVAYLGTATYHGDFVFLDDAKLGSDASCGVDVTSDVYFIGTTNEPGFLHEGDDDFWGSLKSTRFVFAGRTVQNDPGQDQNKKVEGIVTRSGVSCYFISRGGSEIITTGTNKSHTYTVTSAGSSVPDDMTTAYNKYANYDCTSASGKFPDSLSSVFKDIKPCGTAVAGSAEVLDYATWSVDGTAYAAGVTIPEGTEYIVEPLTSSYPDYKKVDGNVPEDHIIDLDDLDSLDKNGDKIIDIETEINDAHTDGGYFLIDPGQVYENSNTCVPYVIAIDANHGSEYRFFFASGVHQLKCVVFAMYNTGSSTASPCYFILESGAQLKACDAQYFSSDKGSGLAGSGFISVDRGYTSGKALGDYIHDTFMYNERPAGTTDTYSKYYDNEKKPMMFIFGEGSTTSFQFGAGSILEGYLGLYNGGSVDYLTDIHDDVWIYGRIEAYQIPTYNTTGKFRMPYCPAPSENTNPDGNKPAETAYKVVNIIYYY